MPDHRLLGDWLTSYLELTSNLEAKESLHRWTGLICLSTAIQRKLYIDMEHGRVHPNLYVFIVALSGAARKSTAMGFGQKLLIQAFPDLKIFRDDLTAQGLVKALNHSAIANRDGKRIEEMRSDFVIFADELSNLFDYEKTRAAKLSILLTSIYMCPDVYDHLTSRDSLERIYNLYPVILGATDPKNINVFPENATGGLFGRIIWVIERERRHANPGWIEDLDREKVVEQELLREMLLHDIQRVHRMEGNFTTTVEARKFYNDWYLDLPSRSKGDEKTNAFFSRCHTTAIQLAMLLSVSESESKILTLQHVEKGIQMIEEQFETIGRVMTLTGTSQYEQARAKFIVYLQNKPSGMELRTKLLKFMGMPVELFDKEIVETLITDETIVRTMLEVRGRKEIVIKLTPNGLEKKVEIPS